MDRQIICGEIKETFTGTPIEIFKKAVQLSAIENWTVKTNNPQLVEALEVLCGEKTIRYFIYLNDEYCEQEKVKDIYNYLGDVYNIIDSLRFEREFDDDFDILSEKEYIQKEIDEYEMKHQYPSEELHPVNEDKFEEYEEIQEPPKHIQAYKTNEPIVFRDKWGHKRVAKIGNWIIKYSDGSMSVYTDSLIKRYKKVNK